MDILNERIRIEVSEPFEWTYGSLYGHIKETVSDMELLIRLDEPIAGKSLSSDLLKVSTRYQGDSFSIDDFSLANDSEGCFDQFGK